MLPTLAGNIRATKRQRDLFYKGCPIHQCWLSSLFPEEDQNLIAKDWEWSRPKTRRKLVRYRQTVRANRSGTASDRNEQK
jgi:hypothetical protein